MLKGGTPYGRFAAHQDKNYLKKGAYSSHKVQRENKTGIFNEENGKKVLRPSKGAEPLG
jgi:hypothetical protein